jgi:nitrate/nitrite transporter NarK
MPSHLIHRFLPPSAVSRARHNVHLRRFWERLDRRSMVCLDRQYGKFERGLWVPSSMLCIGCNCGAIDCYSHDLERRSGVVCVLLHYGLSLPRLAQKPLIIKRFQIGASALELTTSAWTFWKQTGSVYQAENPQDPNAKTGRTREALKNRVTWLFALFIFGYVGAEVSLGGWIVVFMTKIRHASSFASGASATGFWGGMTVGRLFLSFLTARLGEFRSVLLYLSLAVILELIFWLVPSLITSAVTVALLGVVMGPMFPTAIVLITKLLPRSLHVGTIGFGTAFGGSGGAVFPFIVGAIAQKKGVKTLQPIILALLAAIAALWLCMPRGRGKDHENGEIERGFDGAGQETISVQV